MEKSEKRRGQRATDKRDDRRQRKEERWRAEMRYDRGQADGR